MATLYTIGHSTRSLDELLTVLKAHAIRRLVDIRAFPVSRRLPHFSRELLETALPAAGIRYWWMKELGGYRKKILEYSPNVALRNAAFRHYADYMMTPEFEKAVGELVGLAQPSRLACMCAERVWFHCHRMLVSDWLVAHGNPVLHIDGEGPAQPHYLSREAQRQGDQLIYPGDTLFPERTWEPLTPAPATERRARTRPEAVKGTKRTGTGGGGQ
ncbi:MAG TPA: DUF488 domain-containing protein [Terriglobales bacterium]|nr:DUF488 domain-containing protein [Terriglobales bacterium]